MRRRILSVAISAVVLAVLVLGLPLAFTVHYLVDAQQDDKLQRLALRSATLVSPDFRAGDRVELPADPDATVAVYDANGRRVQGGGPGQLRGEAARALAGRVVAADTRELLVAAVPVTSGERVIAVVRASSPESTVWSRTWAWWGGLAGLCVFAALCAGGVAALESRRLAAPLVRLAVAATAVGEGDFSIRTSASGVPEIDAVGNSLNRTTDRLSALLQRERAFSAQASHQLKTPLTQLQLELEHAISADHDFRSSAESALATVEELARTVDDVLAIARQDAPQQDFDTQDLLEQCRRQWHGPLSAVGRLLSVEVDAPRSARASLPAVRQILHVLLDNALRHGAGTVTLRTRDAHGAVAIDVIDEGTAPPISLQDSGRLGLSLARNVARAQDGRLLVDQTDTTRFTLLLPSVGEG